MKTLFLVTAILGADAALGQPVGSEFRVNTYTTSYQGDPSVASDSSGNFVVVWDSSTQDGSNLGVYAQRYSSVGAALGIEFRVSAYTTGVQASASIASSSTGTVVIVWSDGSRDGSQSGIDARRYGSAGAPLGGEFLVNSHTTDSQYDPSVASDSFGNFVVVWTSYTQDGSMSGVYAQRYGSAGGALGGEFRVNTYTTYGQSHPAVASDSSGNFVVVWQSYAQDGELYGIYAQRYGSDGMPRGGEFRVNTTTIESQLYPSVASDASGTFMVAWQSPDVGTSFGIWAQRYGSSGAPLGGEFLVNTYTTGPQYLPSVAADSLGNMVVAWESFDQNLVGRGIYAQRYGSSGAPLGGEFRVNSYTTGGHVSPSVAAASSGLFVVVYRSDKQDYGTAGVFGQKFGPICGHGDVDASGTADVADVFYLINSLFAGGAAPVCSGDVDGNGGTDVADVFYLINYLFAGGPPPH